MRATDNAEAQQQQQHEQRAHFHLDVEDGMLPGSLEGEVAAQLASHPGLAAAGPGQWLQLCRVVRPQFVRQSEKGEGRRRTGGGGTRTAIGAG